jgi:general secretion pathway protein A
LRVEDGLIEVGWEPESESPSTEVDGETALSPETREDDRPSPLAEEAIHDRYAALQAWNEWARNQGRTATVEPAVVPNERAVPSGELDEDPAEANSQHSAIAPGVWAEGQQNFAPYSQLFTRLKQRRDSN